MTDPQTSQNPLLADWTGAFGLPPFAAVAPDKFRPAFDAALAAHRAEIDAIASDPAAPSFDNTIAALERSGRALDRVSESVLGAGRRRHQRRHRSGRARDVAAARPSFQRHVSEPRALCPHRRRFTRAARRSALTPSRPACSTATTPASCAPAPRWRSRRRSGLRPSTSGWRASALSLPRTCWPTRRLTRSCWRRAISPACPTSRAPPRARRRRSEGHRANSPSRWRAPPARPSCSFRRAATCARRCSRPGSGAARTAARPTTAPSSPRRCAYAPSAPSCSGLPLSPTTGSTTRWPRRRRPRASCWKKCGAARAPRRAPSATPCRK